MVCLNMDKYILVETILAKASGGLGITKEVLQISRWGYGFESKLGTKLFLGSGEGTDMPEPLQA